MNLRLLNNKCRIFDSYSSLDVPVVKNLNRFGAVLIGGTAIQHMAHYYGVKERRKRSIDDLDFIMLQSNPNRDLVNRFLLNHGFKSSMDKNDGWSMHYHSDTDGVDVDILISVSSDIVSSAKKVGSILCIDPVEQYLQKVERVTISDVKRKSDIADIYTLYDIIVKLGREDELYDKLDDLSLTEEQQLFYNEIAKNYH